MNFFIKQMLAKQMANMPAEQKEKVLKAFDENPDFFKKLIQDISDRLKKGEPQQAAIMAVLTTHKAELQKILKP
ncbi:hypothetical protein K2X83_02610, partial [Patescibacteria group bacterium]|nr:hypothetical protein [Patescibacteria group bacterium]